MSMSVYWASETEAEKWKENKPTFMSVPGAKEISYQPNESQGGIFCSLRSHLYYFNTGYRKCIILYWTEYYYCIKFNWLEILCESFAYSLEMFFSIPN